MSNLLEHVAQSVQSRQLIRRGQSVLVAVSGGADSMVLLHLLNRLAATNGWRLVVAHFNHLLRGAESDADEQLARETASRLNLRFVGGRGDVRRHQKAGKSSLEMAARELRHDFLGRTAAHLKIPTIALGHHADDQVELFFLRLLRGAGGEGLSGMKWKNLAPFHASVQLVRPLLDQTKAALLAYARTEHVAFREDASNVSPDFLRNRIRHELLPLLAKRYEPSVLKTVFRSMEIIGAEAEYTEEIAQRWLEDRPKLHFHRLPTAVQRQILRLQLLRLGVTPEFDLVEHLRLAPDQPISVAENETLTRDENGKVHREKLVRTKFSRNETNLHLNRLPREKVFAGVRISWRLDLSSGQRSLPKFRLDCEYFDATKVGRRIVLRHWRQGDRFQPIGMDREVKLQDFFTNLKIPRDQRRKLIVAATKAGTIFWVEGLRIGEGFKLDKATQRRLKWQWQRLTALPVASSQRP